MIKGNKYLFYTLYLLVFTFILDYLFATPSTLQMLGISLLLSLTFGFGIICFNFIEDTARIINKYL